LLTIAGQHLAPKPPLCGIAVFKKKLLLCNTILNLDTMKMLTDSLRHFFEGFASFYTSIYDEMKKW
jgi:hypothetical protein